MGAVWESMRQARKAAGLSIDGLSHKIRMSREHLRRLERGQRGPTAETIAKIESALGKLGPPPRKGPRRLTNEELSYAHQQRLAGVKLKPLAAELGCDPSTLSGRLIDWADRGSLSTRYRPGRRPCLCCGNTFESWDVASNKVCGRCKSLEDWY